MSDSVCKVCQRKGGREVMDPHEFKRRFKVGDELIGWSTQKRIVITPIGEERFLYRQPSHKPHKEKVSSMRATLWALAPTVGGK